MQYPTYDPASQVTPLGEDELVALDALLQSLPVDGAMTLDGVDGYLTALLVSPRPLAQFDTADWLPAIWGGDPAPGSAAPFASNQKKKRCTVLLLRHLRALAAQLADDPAGWEPVFSVAEVAGGEELADATDWCLGFLAAIDLAPDDWAPLRAEPGIGSGLALVAVLGGDAAPGPDEDPDDPRVRDAWSREVAELVPLLWARRAGA